MHPSFLFKSLFWGATVVYCHTTLILPISPILRGYGGFHLVSRWMGDCLGMPGIVSLFTSLYRYQRVLQFLQWKQRLEETSSLFLVFSLYRLPVKVEEGKWLVFHLFLFFHFILPLYSISVGNMVHFLPLWLWVSWLGYFTHTDFLNKHVTIWSNWLLHWKHCWDKHVSVLINQLIAVFI